MCKPIPGTNLLECCEKAPDLFPDPSEMPGVIGDMAKQYDAKIYHLDKWLEKDSLTLTQTVHAQLKPTPDNDPSSIMMIAQRNEDTGFNSLAFNVDSAERLMNTLMAFLGAANKEQKPDA